MHSLYNLDEYIVAEPITLLLRFCSGVSSRTLSNSEDNLINLPAYIACRYKSRQTHLIVQGDTFHTEQVQSQPQHSRSHSASTTRHCLPLALQDRLSLLLTHSFFKLFEDLVTSFECRVRFSGHDVCILGEEEVEWKRKGVGDVPR